MAQRYTTTLAEALGTAGIELKSHTIGKTYRVRCPRCNKQRRDDALSVTIKAVSDVVWTCWRCKWSSGWRKGSSSDISWTVNAEPVRHSAKLPHGSGLSDYWHRIVGAANLVAADDLAGRYLTGRCCDLPRNDVLFHPSVWHPQERRSFPAMIGVITDIRTGARISLHFTFLDPDGNGKAPIDTPRLYLKGHSKRGVVRLTPDDEITRGVIIGEGLETCLSYALEYNGNWACLDAGNLEAFPVLPGLEGITVLIDNDAAGRRAFSAVRDRYRAAGFVHPLDIIGVEIVGESGADVNDLARTA
jgi:putative DNA primase/helicase